MANRRRGDDLIERATRQAQHDGLLELACALSLAVYVEPGLLRQARLALLPRSPVALEAELWFSPIVMTRNPTGVVFDPDALGELRARLADRPTLADRAHALVERLHQHYPATLRLEEALSWALVRQGGHGVEHLLRPVLKAMTEHADDGVGVARWVAQAWNRLPEQVKQIETGRQLEVAATLRIGISVGRARPGDHALPTGLSWLSPRRSPRRHRLGLEQGENGLRFVDPDDRHLVIEVPAATPPVVELSWTADGQRHYRVVPAIAATEVTLGPGVSDLVVRTLEDRQVVMSARPVSSRPRLPIEVRNRLVTLLIEIEDLGENSVRSLLESELRARIGPEFSVPGHAALSLYVLALVEECENHPGGLRKLLDALRLISPGHYRIEEVADLIAVHVPLELLRPSERADLRRLLTGLTVELDVLGLYRAAVGPLAPPLTVPSADLLAVIDELANAMSPPGQLPPLLVFVEHLACAVETVDDISTALRQWSTEVVRRCELPSQLLEVVRESARSRIAKPPARPTLLVQVEEDGVDPDHYLVSIWLRSSDTASHRLVRDDQTHALAQVPELVNQALVTANDLLDASGSDLTVEFILPHRLLLTPVDNWLVEAGTPFARRLGTDYPVVVRSLERLRNKSLPLRSQWRAKWRWLQERSGLEPGAGVRWIDPGDDPQRLFRELAGEQPVCLAWNGPPPPEQQQADSVLGAAIFAGTPIALWCREERIELAELAQLFDTNSLQNLPDAVHRLRQEADRADGDHLGHHLTLLWDDPTRLPEPDLRPAPAEAE